MKRWPDPPPDYTVPLSEVKAVKDGRFHDSDGSVYVLPRNVCIDLDDDCRLDEHMTQLKRMNCARYEPWRGRCPFVET
jgi:hypothetical protein